MRKIQHSTNTWVLALIVLTCGLNAQGAPADDHDSEGHAPHDHGFEIGLSTGYTYLANEDESALGLHLHLMRRLSGEGFLSHFGVGVGFETIFADHDHHAVMGSVALYPWRNLVLTVSPGVIFADHDGEWENEYATHFEASYGFKWGKLEVGPFVGFSQGNDDRHYMAGLHIGWGFE